MPIIFFRHSEGQRKLPVSVCARAKVMLINRARASAVIFCCLLTFSVAAKTVNAKPAPEWAKNAVFYEVNIRQYTQQGTFDALRAHLPRLKALGADVLWLMPIHPIGKLQRKGTLGSYYAVRDFREINPEFGDKNAFALLVKEAHALGFKVILDWVAHHTAPDHVWIKPHPDWYQRTGTGEFRYLLDWYDTASLDYANRDMATAMIADMQYWVDEFAIDGFRCDFAGAVPLDFWRRATQQLNQNGSLLMLAEDGRQRELFGAGFHMNYGASLHLAFLEVAEGRMGIDQFRQLNKEIVAWYPSDRTALNFLSNHDENSWRKSAPERFGDRVPAFTVLSYLLPGLPLIYSGQEAGLGRPLAFFEKDLIPWRDHSMAQLYRDLSLILKSEAALWEFSGDSKLRWHSLKALPNLLVFERYREGSRVMVMVNFSDKPMIASENWRQEIFEAERKDIYREVLRGPITMAVNADEKIKKSTLEKGKSQHTLSLPPWGYAVYVGATRAD